MITQTTIQNRLGNDLKIPINNNFEPISGLDLLLQDIQQLLLTSPGERVFRPTWGCGLKALIWENIDYAQSAGANIIQNALINFEPRIKVLSVKSTINRNSDLITFVISFNVIPTDQITNLVFPFRTGVQLSQK